MHVVCANVLAANGGRAVAGLVMGFAFINVRFVLTAEIVALRIRGIATTIATV